MILSSFGRRLIALADADTVKAALGIVATVTDEWASQPIGVPIPVFDNIAGVTAPPKDKAYRYIEMTAGKTGSGAYNEGILTSESVSGSSPTVTATAVISLSGSPINGQTVRLINSERRFLRAGSAGTLQDSDNLAHTHTTNGFYTAGGAGTDNYSGTGPVQNKVPRSVDSSGGSEARPRNVGVTYYMRVK